MNSLSDKTVLAVHDLAFCWPSGQQNVLDIDQLVLHQGERVFIKGESGSGKTTLLSLVGGINQANQGRIEVLGQDLAKMKSSQRDHFRADHIGFIFQLFNLIPYLSVIENITLACKFSQLRTQRVLRHSNSLEDEAKRLLAHLNLDSESLMHKPVIELSVGQQQRVATARALIGEPELIIADEPTSALDTHTRAQFIDLLLKECEASGASVLFVSHDSGLESHFDRTILLNEVNRAAPNHAALSEGEAE